ncbi:MAG: sulfatase-like hydrolase/transferase, partial [Gammaproteobacteria bacterium]
VAVAACYSVAFGDPYIALFMAPFFALGCARGKRPLVLLALSLVPALFLLAGSAVKFSLTGVPLVSYDQYFLRQNVLILAYNDWRVAASLLATAAATLLYIRHLFTGRGLFSRFEKWALVALAVACTSAIADARQWDRNFVNWEMVLGTPSLRTLVMSARIPAPTLPVPATAEAAPGPDDSLLGAPAGPLPDIYFVLEESTFPPALVRPGYSPHTLFAGSAPNSGPLHVSTFAGATWKTEFSVTTQMRPQEFGSDGLYVFHQLEGRIRRSVFTQLKTLGYRTMVFYPVPGNFINAKSFYESIGVDEFYDPEALGVSAGWDWSLSDAALYDAMLKKIGDSEAPVVAMMLTIRQHGPHDSQDPMADYLARFEASDLAYGGFLDRLAQRGRKAGVVAFGDHQPDFTARYLPDHAAWYFTAYDIRCINFTCATAGSRGGRALDVVMLTPLALEKFGFRLDGLSAFQRHLFETCDDDTTRCDDSVRRRFDGAFARFVD